MPSPSNATRTQSTGQFAPTGVSDPTSHTQTLIELLEDDSPVVFAEVREELGRVGKAAHRALRCAARGGPARRRGRARQLLLDMARRRQVRRLVRYASRAEHDLEKALFLLDRHANPGADSRTQRRVLDALGNKLRRRIRVLTPGPERVTALVSFLAGDVGFAGTDADHHDPANIYLSNALMRRTGMPLTLCAIYAFTARRAGLRAGLLPFPGHVLLAVHEAGRSFILDPFGGGKLLDRHHCANYLAAHEVPYSDSYLQEATDTQMFLRHVGNLIHSCKRSGRSRDARELAHVRQVLRRTCVPAASPT